MFEVLKTIHLLCLLLGGAASLGNAVLFRRVQAAGGPPPPLVADVMRTLGNMGLAAILTLWATGIPLAIMTGAFAAGGIFFGLKLLAATAVLIIVPAMILLRNQVAAGRRPPNPALIGRMALATRLLVAIAIVLAVLAFN